MPRKAFVAWIAGFMLLGGISNGCADAGNFRSGDNVAISANETIPTDLYVAGEEITIDGTVQGDVFAAGSLVSINGQVQGDIYAAGGRVSVRGPVQGNVFAAGGDVDVTGQIGRDAFLAGGNVDLTGPVGGDVRAGGGNLVITSQVKEDVLLGGGNLAIRSGSTIGGNLLVGGDTVSLEGSVNGNISGDAVDYRRTGVVSGRENVRIRQRTAREDRVPTAQEQAVDHIRNLVTLLLIGLLLVWLRPRWLEDLSRPITTNPLMSLLWGAVAWLATIFGGLLFTVGWIILAVVIGVLSLGGLAALVASAGLVLDVLAIFGFTLSAAVIAWLAVAFALAKFSSIRLLHQPATNRFLLIAAGLAVLVLLTAIPVLGGFVTLFVLLAGVGAIGQAIYAGFHREPAAAPAAEV